MSSVVDPIITVRGDRKITVVSISLAAGTTNGSAQAVGLGFANQVLSARLVGAGATVVNGFLVDPFLQGNVVGVSVLAGNVTAKVEIQGF